MTEFFIVIALQALVVLACWLLSRIPYGKLWTDLPSKEERAAEKRRRKHPDRARGHAVE